MLIGFMRYYVVVDSFYIVASIVSWGSVFHPCFLCRTWRPCWFYKQFDEKERDVCFNSIVCLMYCDYFFLVVLWVGQQCIVDVIPGHTN